MFIAKDVNASVLLNCRPLNAHNQLNQSEQGGEDAFHGDSCAQGHGKGTLSHAVSISSSLALIMVHP